MSSMLMEKTDEATHCPVSDENVLLRRSFYIIHAYVQASQSLIHRRCRLSLLLSRSASHSLEEPPKTESIV